MFRWRLFLLLLLNCLTGSCLNLNSSLIFVLFSWLYIAHQSEVKITSFVSINRINFLLLNWNSDMLLYMAKMLLKLPKLLLVKLKSLTSREQGSCNFWLIANSTFNKGEYAIHPLCSGPENCLLHLMKQIYLMKPFLRFLVSDDLGISLPVVSSRINLKHNIWFVITWFVKDWSWVYSTSGSEELWAWALVHISGTLCILKTLDYFLDCSIVSSVIPVFKSVEERAIVKNYSPGSLLSEFNKIFRTLVNKVFIPKLFLRFSSTMLKKNFRHFWARVDYLHEVRC